MAKPPSAVTNRGSPTPSHTPVSFVFWKWCTTSYLSLFIHIVIILSLIHFQPTPHCMTTYLPMCSDTNLFVLLVCGAPTSHHLQSVVQNLLKLSSSFSGRNRSFILQISKKNLWTSWCFLFRRMFLFMAVNISCAHKCFCVKCRSSISLDRPYEVLPMFTVFLK